MSTVTAFFVLGPVPRSMGGRYQTHTRPTRQKEQMRRPSGRRCGQDHGFQVQDLGGRGSEEGAPAALSFLAAKAKRGRAKNKPQTRPRVPLHCWDPGPSPQMERSEVEGLEKEHGGGRGGCWGGRQGLELDSKFHRGP